MKRMKHPQHGWMHAYNPNEEAYLRTLGWGDDDPVKVVEPAFKVFVEPEPEPVVEVPAKRGPGRPRKVITG